MLGYSARGELELACQVGQVAADPCRRKRRSHVSSFLPGLEQALIQYGSGPLPPV
jgi:hypothetical protein